MSSAISIPHHQLSESPYTRSIAIADWRISARTQPIATDEERTALERHLRLPLPEMTFPNNTLQIVHAPSGFALSFDAKSALEGVKVGTLNDEDGGVKVGYSDAWLKTRTDPTTQQPMTLSTPSNPHDWTYTTTYTGHVPDPAREAPVHPPPNAAAVGDFPDKATSTAWSNGRPVAWAPAQPGTAQHEIPLAELTRPDPILYYAEVPLFEDELHDNGSSLLVVRVRVMPTCIFLLSRFALRVDNVLCRIHDTRLYVSLTSDAAQPLDTSPPPNVVVRQIGGWEAPYDAIFRRLPDKSDRTPLRDPTFIAKVLTELPPDQSQKPGAVTQWRGLGTRTEVATLTT
ncbi:type 2A phosphatase activator TIP41 [Coniophora puteana RWD-64-598 SS2]|uniref:Type 2A phosphatase activator TIP41 n=1 Tax=Coniophora puteana (strain RWD-64-598) TaxID=741705 RepID=A0A5M3MBE3_CONPW|nr:type 2A phosphatase activator TIP41 [Coniophora puteana RWD-64-598 SS2]EIW76377.1 type 2A phosphatase activator TIP41 [Coniophora puteana RWD-64-598 SS2]